MGERRSTPAFWRRVVPGSVAFALMAFAHARASANPPDEVPNAGGPYVLAEAPSLGLLYTEANGALPSMHFGLHMGYAGPRGSKRGFRWSAGIGIGDAYAEPNREQRLHLLRAEVQARLGWGPERLFVFGLVGLGGALLVQRGNAYDPPADPGVFARIGLGAHWSVWGPVFVGASVSAEVAGLVETWDRSRREGERYQAFGTSAGLVLGASF